MMQSSKVVDDMSGFNNNATTNITIKRPKKTLFQKSVEKIKYASNNAIKKFTSHVDYRKVLYLRGKGDIDNEHDLNGLNWSTRSALFFHEVKEFLNEVFFPGIPEHYPLKKKLLILKNNSFLGSQWDIFQVLISLLACSLYVAQSYDSSYYAVRFYSMTELITTQFFLMDLVFNYFVSENNFTVFLILSSCFKL
jgi:hypothetical protein